MSLLLLFTGTPSTQTIQVDDTNLYWSPQFVGNGGGAIQSNNVEAGSTVVATWNTGAYHRGRVTAVGTGFIALALDTSGLVGVTAADAPTLYVSVNGGPYTAELLSAGQTQLVIAAALGAGTHDYEVYFKSVGVSGLGSAANRWTLGSAPVFEWRVTGVVIDADASLAPVTVRPGRLLFYGDSLGEGDNATLAYNDTANDIKNPSNDVTQTLGIYAGRAFDCEVAMVVAGGLGLSIKGIGNKNPADATNPSLWNATDANQLWNKRASGVSRSFTAPADYDLILIEIGANDATSFAQAAVTSFLDDLTAASAAEVFWVWYPCDVESVIKPRVIAGIAAAADVARIHFIDVELLITAGDPSAYSSDSVFGGSHPNVRGQAHWTAMAIAGIQAILSASSGGGIRLAGHGGLAA